MSWMLGVICDIKAAWFVFRKLRGTKWGAEIHMKPYLTKQER